MNEHKSILNFDNVSFSYEQKKRVLNKVSIQISAGETIGIIGGNGAGKSTLMKLVTGLLMPEEGTVFVCGQEVTKKTLKAVRKLVGYTFQDPDNQLFMPSVYEDVAFGARQEGLAEEEIEKIVAKTLNQVGAIHLKDKAPYKMSGGEKRLVSLATALASEPQILILDEPAVGLDPRARRQLIRLLKAREETQIITTHDMDMALDLCDRIIVLSEGEVKGDDLPMTIFSNKALLCDNHLELPLRLQGCPICSN